MPMGTKRLATKRLGYKMSGISCRTFHPCKKLKLREGLTVSGVTKVGVIRGGN